MRTSFLLFYILASMVSFSVVAADIEAGKKKAEPCQACHSANGNAEIDAQYPRLAGQYADYLTRALKAYKSGERKNPVMATFAGTLNDDDINNVAAYFSSLPGKLDDLSKHTQGE